MARKNPETSNIDYNDSGKLTREVIPAVVGGGVILGGAGAKIRASKTGVPIFEPQMRGTVPSEGPRAGLGWNAPQSGYTGPTGSVLGNKVGAPRAWNYLANQSEWNPTSKIGKVGKLGANIGSGIVANWAAGKATDWATKTGNHERVQSLTKKLKEQGYDVTHDDVASILLQYADPMAAQKVLGIDYNNYANAVHAGAEITGGIGGGTATSAGLGAWFQGLRNLFEKGAYDERDNMVESIIKQRHGAVQRFNKGAALLGPTMNQGLNGASFKNDMQIPAMGQVGFNAPRKDTEGMSEEELNRRNQYLAMPVHERIWHKDAPTMGGEQFYKDIKEVFPEEQQVVDETNPNAPAAVGKSIAVDPQLRRQMMAEVLNYHGIDSGVDMPDEKNGKLVYSGNPVFKNVLANANSSASDVKKPEIQNGQIVASSQSQLPAPALARPTTPEDVHQNTQTVGAYNGLSPLASEQANYMNKTQRMLTASQHADQLEASLKDPNSPTNRALTRGWNASVKSMTTDNPYRPAQNVPEGMDQATANSLRLLQAGVISPDQMPNQYGQHIQSQLRGETPMHGMNAQAYLGGQNAKGQSGTQGFYDSREADLARGADHLYQQIQQEANATTAEARRKELSNRKPFPWEVDAEKERVNGPINEMARQLPIPVRSGTTFAPSNNVSDYMHTNVPNSTFGANPRIRTDVFAPPRNATEFQGIPNNFYRGTSRPNFR